MLQGKDACVGVKIALDRLPRVRSQKHLTTNIKPHIWKAQPDCIATRSLDILQYYMEVERSNNNPWWVLYPGQFGKLIPTEVDVYAHPTYGIYTENCCTL